MPEASKDQIRGSAVLMCLCPRKYVSVIDMLRRDVEMRNPSHKKAMYGSGGEAGA